MKAQDRLACAAIVLLSVLFGASAPLAAATGRWTPVGPEGGGPLVIAADPRVAARLFAVFPADGVDGLETLVMGSDDGGTSWQERNGGLEGERVISLAVDPQDSDRVFAAAAVQGCSSDGPGGVYRTEDAGAHWQLVATPEVLGNPDCGADILALSDAVLVGTQEGVARSTDGGATWQAVVLTPSPNDVHTLLRDPSDERIVYAAGSQARFKSVDGGLSWTALDDPASHIEGFIRALAISRSDPETLYEYEYNFPSRLWRSRDGGLTWGEAATATATDNIFTVSLVVDPEDPETVFVGVDTGVWASRDGGATFQILRQDLPAMGRDRTRFFGVNALGLDAGGSILLATPTGLWSSGDAGFHWTAKALGGVHANEILFLRFDPFNPRHFLFTSFDTLYETRDGGATFQQLPLPRPGILQALRFDPFRRDRLVALAVERADDQPARTRIFTSTDGARSWKPFAAAPSGASDVAVAAPDVLVVTRGSGIYRRQGGGDWRRQADVEPTDERGFFFFDSIVADPYREGALFALGFDFILHGSTTPVFYRSLDAGAHWFLWHGGATALAFDPVQLDLSYTGEFGKFSRVRISNGKDQRIGRLNPLDSITALQIDRRDPRTFYAATGGSGVLVSHDRARRWSPLAPGLPLDGKALVTVLEQDRANPSRLYATPVTGGLWRLDL